MAWNKLSKISDTTKSAYASRITKSWESDGLFYWSSTEVGDDSANILVLDTGDGLKLNISEDDNAQNCELALEVAAHFRLSQMQAIRYKIDYSILASTRNFLDISIA